MSSLRNGFHDFSHIRSLLGAGCGRLVDNYGLDWWEILSLLLTEQLESVILLQRLAETISADEVYISRPGFQANVLRNLLPDHLQILPVRHNDQSSARHYIRLARKLSVSQIADVFWINTIPGNSFVQDFRVLGRDRDILLFLFRRPTSTCRAPESPTRTRCRSRSFFWFRLEEVVG